MSLVGAKHAAHQAKTNSTNDADRVRYLTEAVYELVKVVDDQDSEIRDLQSKVNRLK